jgi:hypothetical protein
MHPPHPALIFGMEELKDIASSRVFIVGEEPF